VICEVSCFQFHYNRSYFIFPWLFTNSNCPKSCASIFSEFISARIRIVAFFGTKTFICSLVVLVIPAVLLSILPKKSCSFCTIFLNAPEVQVVFTYIIFPEDYHWFLWITWWTFRIFIEKLKIKIVQFSSITNQLLSIRSHPLNFLTIQMGLGTFSA